MWFTERAVHIIKREEQEKLEQSILSRMEVQRALSSGAPPTPWELRSKDRESIDLLARYFAQAIPVPTPDGRVRIVESMGYAGPQLAIYVPVLSDNAPVAVLTRNWYSGTELETDLFFFGALDGRLAAMVSQLGFHPRGAQQKGITVFQHVATPRRKRAS
jgi:hypothetical protein